MSDPEPPQEPPDVAEPALSPYMAAQAADLERLRDERGEVRYSADE